MNEPGTVSCTEQKEVSDHSCGLRGTLAEADGLSKSRGSLRDRFPEVSLRLPGEGKAEACRAPSAGLGMVSP